MENINSVPSTEGNEYIDGEAGSESSKPKNKQTAVVNDKRDKVAKGIKGKKESYISIPLINSTATANTLGQLNDFKRNIFTNTSSAPSTNSKPELINNPLQKQHQHQQHQHEFHQSLNSPHIHNNTPIPAPGLIPQFPVITYPHICLGPHVPLPPPPPGGFPPQYPVHNDAVPPMFRPPFYNPNVPFGFFPPPPPHMAGGIPPGIPPGMPPGMFPQMVDVQPMPHTLKINTSENSPNLGSKSLTSDGSINGMDDQANQSSSHNKRRRTSTASMNNDKKKSKSRINKGVDVKPSTEENESSEKNSSSLGDRADEKSVRTVTIDHNNNKEKDDKAAKKDKISDEDEDKDDEDDDKSENEKNNDEDNDDSSDKSTSFESAQEGDYDDEEDDSNQSGNHGGEEHQNYQRNRESSNNGDYENKKIKERKYNIDGRTKKAKVLSNMFHSFNAGSNSTSFQAPSSLEASVNSFKCNGVKENPDIIVFGHEKGSETIQERRKRHKKREKRDFINETVKFSYNKEYKRMKFINYDSKNPKNVTSSGPAISLNDATKISVMSGDIDFFNEYKKIDPTINLDH